MGSPWGAVQNTEKLERGISWVSTAGHGGLRVSRGYAMAHLSPEVRAEAIDCDDYLYYEEDIGWAIAALDLPHLWGRMGTSLDALRVALSGYKPYLLAYRGIELDETQYNRYMMQREANQLRESKDPDYIVAALGIDKAKTKVWTADDAEHIVTRESYRKVFEGFFRDYETHTLLSLCETA